MIGKYYHKPLKIKSPQIVEKIKSKTEQIYHQINEQPTLATNQQVKTKWRILAEDPTEGAGRVELRRI